MGPSALAAILVLLMASGAQSTSRWVATYIACTLHARFCCLQSCRAEAVQYPKQQQHWPVQLPIQCVLVYLNAIFVCEHVLQCQEYQVVYHCRQSPSCWNAAIPSVSTEQVHVNISGSLW
jgi:hypothetical protein